MVLFERARHCFLLFPILPGLFPLPMKGCRPNRGLLAPAYDESVTALGLPGTVTLVGTPRVCTDAAPGTSTFAAPMGWSTGFMARRARAGDVPASGCDRPCPGLVFMIDVADLANGALQLMEPCAFRWKAGAEWRTALPWR